MKFPALVVSSALVLAACGGGGGDDSSSSEPAAADTTTTSIVLTSDGVLRIRPVLSLLPIDDMPLNPFGDDDPAGTMVSPNVESTIAYDLGPAVATEEDVTAATPVEVAGQWQMTITLTAKGTKAVKELAKSCAAKEPTCEAGQLAVTIDGFVMSAIPGEAGDVGPDVTLSAALSEDQAAVIAEALG